MKTKNRSNAKPVTANKGDNEKKHSIPMLTIPEAAEFLVALIGGLDWRILEEMCEMWGAEVRELNSDDRYVYEAFVDYIDGNMGMVDSIPFDAPVPHCEPADCNRAKRKVAGKPKSRNRKGNRTVSTKGGRK